eukprot:scaffold1033_cov408-Prasinococcus_capsulatus_cf.AAC.25
MPAALLQARVHKRPPTNGSSDSFAIGSMQCAPCSHRVDVRHAAHILQGDRSHQLAITWRPGANVLAHLSADALGLER